MRQVPALKDGLVWQGIGQALQLPSSQARSSCGALESGRSGVQHSERPISDYYHYQLLRTVLTSCCSCWQLKLADRIPTYAWGQGAALEGSGGIESCEATAAAVLTPECIFQGPWAQGGTCQFMRREKYQVRQDEWVADTERKEKR